MNGYRTCSLASALCMLVVFVLGSSFALHAVQVPHSHYGEHSSSTSHDHPTEEPTSSMALVGEYMHTAEKKMWFVAAASLLIGAFFQMYSWALFINQQNLHSRVVLQRRRNYVFSEDHLSFSLARGILHSKLY